jgi:hypothetical protein
MLRFIVIVYIGQLIAFITLVKPVNLIDVDGVITLGQVSELDNGLCSRQLNYEEQRAYARTDEHLFHMILLIGNMQITYSIVQ